MTDPNPQFVNPPTPAISLPEAVTAFAAASLAFRAAEERVDSASAERANATGAWLEAQTAYGDARRELERAAVASATAPDPAPSRGLDGLTREQRGAGMESG